MSETNTNTNTFHDNEDNTRITDFEDMGLRQDLLRGIFALGFEQPSAVQQRAIVPAATGRDMVIQAQSGTGKTATFAIATLQQLDSSSGEVQALVLSPTRDLALQTQRVMEALAQHMDVRVHASVGGRDARADGQVLARGGVQVVTGTPGRVLDQIERGRLSTRQLRVLVLDEADVMLDAGFQEQVRLLLAEVPRDTQIMCVSATMPPEVLRLTDQFMRDPLRLLIKQEEITLAGIAQFYVDCGSDNAKIDVLLDLYETLTVSQCVIFCNTRRRVLQVADELTREDFSVSVIHADLTQAEREQVLAEFVAGSTRVLVATDIIGRGLDVQQVSVVVNFDLPYIDKKDSYIHRVGRGGRFGRKAITINLVTERDARTLQAIEQYFHTEIPAMPTNVRDYLS